MGFTDEVLNTEVRDAIHRFALQGREILTREAHDLLEGVYGLHQSGLFEKPENLPALADADTRQIYQRLKRFLDDETQAGLKPAEAAAKLVKEIAFTHLNRLVAFKMLETSKLIREAVGRGPDSNGFKFYLADQAEDEARWKAGQVEIAYRNFLLWQAGQIAREVPVLFDPENLASCLFPRFPALSNVLALLNAPDIAPAWQAEETIGWVYQYFNEPELQAAFAAVRLSGIKFDAKDIPSATQLFTLRWIVRFLVENTLGRLWVQMHPDSRLKDELGYLVPLSGDIPTEPLRCVREITLLDPACGAMHFGLVAFDLFAEMYREELEHAGQPDWPTTPSVLNSEEIPAAIIQNNLFGIDIDLRAVQLSALALYFKAKRFNKKAQITDHNLACADVLPLNGARLGSFIKEMQFKPIYERLIRKLWERLKSINQLGSLLRLEMEIGILLDEEKARFEREGRQLALFRDVTAEFESDAARDEYWGIMAAQIIQSLDHFARTAAERGQDERFFTKEATKGLQVLELMMRDYDVVVTNPPYLSRNKMNDTLAELLEEQYPEGKGDLYAAFILRCLEFVKNNGYVGMLTMHSFMFIASYEELRRKIVSQACVEALAHLGPGFFSTGNPGTLQTTAFVLHSTKSDNHRTPINGVYFRLVHQTNADAKRLAFEQTLEIYRTSKTTNLPPDMYILAQTLFNSIPSSPWVYWASRKIRSLFSQFPSLADVTLPRQGARTSDNFRFLRFWWEIGKSNIKFNCKDLGDAALSSFHWFPYMKGGDFKRWYGNQSYVVNWYSNGREMKTVVNEKRKKYSSNADGDLWSAWINSYEYYFLEGITYSYLSSINFSARYMPPGFIFDMAGSAIFPPKVSDIYKLLGILNSKLCHFALNLINPTVNFTIGNLKNLPISPHLMASNVVLFAVRQQIAIRKFDEGCFDFVVPLNWQTGVITTDSINSKMLSVEAQVNEDVYQLYDFQEEDRLAIETELFSGEIDEDADELLLIDDDAIDLPSMPNQYNLAVRWISYALGVVLGRFQVGEAGVQGSAIYSRSDFAIGFLPTPDENEFDELVGVPDTFAYVDSQSRRHAFSAKVEKDLLTLALQDGIAVLDEGHPRDLIRLVIQALELMLGEVSAREVIQIGAGGDLRKFLEKDFFTAWHFKCHRKRPVYWPIQSSKRSYGFVLFHEKITRDTFYALQREPFLDTRRNAVALKIADLQGALAAAAGAARKKLEKELDELRKLADELAEFAKNLETITLGGYAPEENWIDDGVILRMAPLWSVLPIWKSEPKKYWERLAAGDFDWSHIAMKYWPARVKEKCKTNKSYAIAHGHEEWYQV